MVQLFLGTSGYKYKDWEGEYYPLGLDSKDNLSYYAGDFNTVEINFTYYSLPNPYIFGNMAKKVPDGFLFSVKVHHSVTHSQELDTGQQKEFIEALKPLQHNSLLGCILAQFPFSFKYNTNNLNYLKKVGDFFSKYNLAVEFRHNSWLNPIVMEAMSNLNMAFSNVDEPQLPGLIPPADTVTSRIGYIRFHGRNAKYWWNHQQAYQRYDYQYQNQELIEWLPRIKKIISLTDKVFIYFNNHYQAKAVKSALALSGLLQDANIITSQN